MTRDYAFDLDFDGAPAFSVFGGKITTARRLAEHALSAFSRIFPHMGPAWTQDSALPGGGTSRVAILATCWRARARKTVSGARRRASSRPCVRIARLAPARLREQRGRTWAGPWRRTYFQAELVYLARKEWARTAEDVLWRAEQAWVASDASATRGGRGGDGDCLIQSGQKPASIICSNDQGQRAGKLGFGKPVSSAATSAASW